MNYWKVVYLNTTSFKYLLKIITKNVISKILELYYSLFRLIICEYQKHLIIEHFFSNIQKFCKIVSPSVINFKNN